MIINISLMVISNTEYNVLGSAEPFSHFVFERQGLKAVTLVIFVKKSNF